MAGELDQDVRSDIAAQIGQQLAGRTGLHFGGAEMALRPHSSAALGESFKVMLLPYDNIQDANPGGLAVRVVDTGQWYHQIYQGASPAQFARSVPRDDQRQHRVVEVAQSTLPEAIGNTISWIDANLPNAADPRLLEAPAYLLTAIWLRDGADEVVVISAIAEGIPDPPLNQRIEAGAFLIRIATQPPVSGLGQRETPRLQER